MPVAEPLSSRTATLMRRLAAGAGWANAASRPHPRPRVRPLAGLDHGAARAASDVCARLLAAIARFRRQLSPAFARRGPLAPILGGLALIALLALVYLGQVSAVTAANQRLQTLQAEQASLQRQDQQVHEQLGIVRSPAYIEHQARAMGLVPAPDGAAVVVTIPGLGGTTRASSGGGEP